MQVADDRAFSFLRVNERQRKPRAEGFTEIRGPYYTLMETRYLEDLLDTMGGRCELGIGRRCGRSGREELSFDHGEESAADRKVKNTRKRPPPHDLESGLC